MTSNEFLIERIFYAIVLLHIQQSLYINCTFIKGKRNEEFNDEGNINACSVVTLSLEL